MFFYGLSPSWLFKPMFYDFFNMTLFLFSCRSNILSLPLFVFWSWIHINIFDPSTVQFYFNGPRKNVPIYWDFNGLCPRLAWLHFWSLGPKQATGSWSMLTDKIYATYFFIRIDLNWLEHSKGGTFSKSFFYVKKQPNLPNVFSLKNIKLGEDFFLWQFSFLNHSIFWNHTQFLACSNQFK